MTQKEVKSAAQQMAKKGASKGGFARANTLTAEERSAIARNAVMARWGRQGKLKKPVEIPQKDESLDIETPEKQIKDAIEPSIPYSILPGELVFGGVEVGCYVLNNLKRVISQKGMVRILGGGRDSGNLQAYLNGNPLFTKDFLAGVTIRFKIPGIPGEAIGYDGGLLIDICDKYIEAWDTGKLKISQGVVVKRAQAVIRACAKLGIVALIDEATGYQKVRSKQALQLKLKAFIAEEMQDWAVMFPETFWIELARLEGVRYSPRSRPLRWGKYVMYFVYDAIDKEVGKTLREKNKNPHYLQNHHQWLKKFGRDAVHDQIERVVTIMKLCDDMVQFRKKFARVFATEAQLDFDETLGL